MPTSPAELIERVVVGSVAITARAIETAGAELTFSQWRVLFIVGEQPAGASVGELAFRVGVNASPASRLVSRLKERGFVQTTREDPDGRVTRVKLTAAGRFLRRRVLGLRQQDVDAILATAALTHADTQFIERLALAFESFT